MVPQHSRNDVILCRIGFVVVCLPLCFAQLYAPDLFCFLQCARTCRSTGTETDTQTHRHTDRDTQAQRHTDTQTEGRTRTCIERECFEVSLCQAFFNRPCFEFFNLRDPPRFARTDRLELLFQGSLTFGRRIRSR